MKKLTFKNFFKPTPAKWLKLAWAIKTITGTVGTSLYVSERPNLGFAVLLIGAAADVIIQFIGDGTTA